MKRKALTALAMVAMIAAGVLFWKVIIFLMWTAYYLGIPM